MWSERVWRVIERGNCVEARYPCGGLIHGEDVFPDTTWLKTTKQLGQGSPVWQRFQAVLEVVYYLRDSEAPVTISVTTDGSPITAVWSMTTTIYNQKVVVTPGIHSDKWRICDRCDGSAEAMAAEAMAKAAKARAAAKAAEAKAAKADRKAAAWRRRQERKQWKLQQQTLGMK